MRNPSPLAAASVETRAVRGTGGGEEPGLGCEEGAGERRAGVCRLLAQPQLAGARKEGGGGRREAGCPTWSLPRGPRDASARAAGPWARWASRGSGVPRRGEGCRAGACPTELLERGEGEGKIGARCFQRAVSSCARRPEMLLTGETAARAVNRQRRAPGVATARGCVLCHLRSAAGCSAPPPPQRFFVFLTISG